MSNRSLTRRLLYVAALGAAGAYAVLANAAPACADPADDQLVTNYASFAQNAICGTLDDHPTLPGMAGVVMFIEGDGGFNVDQATQVVSIAVGKTCTQHAGLLARFESTAAGSGFTPGRVV